MSSEFEVGVNHRRGGWNNISIWLSHIAYQYISWAMLTKWSLLTRCLQVKYQNSSVLQMQSRLCHSDLTSSLLLKLGPIFLSPFMGDYFSSSSCTCTLVSLCAFQAFSFRHAMAHTSTQFLSPADFPPSCTHVDTLLYLFHIFILSECLLHCLIIFVTISLFFFF